jgi:hypothetical protein
LVLWRCVLNFVVGIKFPTHTQNRGCYTRRILHQVLGQLWWLPSEHTFILYGHEHNDLALPRKTIHRLSDITSRKDTHPTTVTCSRFRMNESNNRLRVCSLASNQAIININAMHRHKSDRIWAAMKQLPLKFPTLFLFDNNSSFMTTSSFNFTSSAFSLLFFNLLW